MAHLKITLANLYEKYAQKLELELQAGHRGMHRCIPLPEAQRPGLGLTGYVKGISSKRILLFGKAEISYLRELTPGLCLLRLQAVLRAQVPAVILAHNQRPPKMLRHLCEELAIPLFRSRLTTIKLQSHLMALLSVQFAPTICCHGSLVEVFGMGVLIQGESAIGKSEAALGLIERGHRLVSDDLVKVRKLDTGLEGFGVEVTRHHMEVRGIGIINVAALFGVACVVEKKSLDIVVKLEVWDDTHFYDRAGIEEKTVTILGSEVPYHLLPVKPGRDVVLLLETVALNRRLQTAGFHAARELDHQLLAAIATRAHCRTLGKQMI